MANQQISTGTFGVAKFVVSPDASQGNYTTITAAIAAAVAEGGSGKTVFVRNGTYVEDFTIGVGINLCGLPGDQSNPNVAISGKITYSASGGNKSSISNIFLKTNSDYAISITGAGELSLNDCYIQCSDNTAISITSTGSLQAFNCKGEIVTTGITYFDISAGGNANFKNCIFSNSGSSTTASTIGAANVTFSRSTMAFPVSLSSSGTLGNYHCENNLGGLNATVFTLAGTSSLDCLESSLGSGTEPCISVGSGTLVIAASNVVDSSNTYVFTGLGTISTGGNVCTNSSGNNVSTINHLTVI